MTTALSKFPDMPPEEVEALLPWLDWAFAPTRARFT